MSTSSTYVNFAHAATRCSLHPNKTSTIGSNKESLLHMVCKIHSHASNSRAHVFHSSETCLSCSAGVKLMPSEVKQRRNSRLFVSNQIESVCVVYEYLCADSSQQSVNRFRAYFGSKFQQAQQQTDANPCSASHALMSRADGIHAFSDRNNASGTNSHSYLSCHLCCTAYLSNAPLASVSAKSKVRFSDPNHTLRAGPYIHSRTRARNTRTLNQISTSDMTLCTSS